MPVPNSNEFGFELFQLIEENLDLEQWGFHLSYTKLEERQGISNRRIIYDSEWCRLQFIYSRRVLPDENELHRYYGRLHATNDGNLLGKGEKCYCWHDAIMPLFFLDGLTPIEALQRNQPAVLKEFRESPLSTRATHPLVGILEQSVIWEHYGARFFELFDLRRPNLWNQYVTFLEEYYRLDAEETRHKGINLIPFDPPLYKVC
jgi:hypothetical protein